MTQDRGVVVLLACALLALVGCSGGEPRLVFAAQPGSTLSGELLAPVVVELQDGEGKALQAPATVTLRQVGEGASLGGTLRVQASGGKATFSDLWVDGGASGLVLEASVEGLEEAVQPLQSEAFDVEAVKLRFVGVREAYRADLPLDAFRVELLSAKDERVLAVQRPVTLGVGNNPTGAVLSGAQVTAVDGRATFDGLRVDRAGQGYTLVASARGAASATSGAFTLRHAQEEREPKDKAAAGAQLNDTLQTAEALAVGLPLFGDLSPSATVAGGAVSNDVDSYRFSARAGELLEVSTYATRLDQAHWKHGIRITLLAVEGLRPLYRMGADDFSGEDVDFGLKQVRIPADGEYLLVLTPDAAADELDGGRYAAWVQLSGAPALLQLEAEAAGQAGVNDTQATAQTLVPGMLYGSYEGLAASGDGMVEGDIYKLHVDGPTRIRLALTAHRNGHYVPSERDGYYDPELQLYDAEGRLLFDNDDTYWYDSTVEQLLGTAGDYYVRVTRCCGQGSAPYFLSYSAEAVQPLAQPATNTSAAQPMGIAYGQYVGVDFTSVDEVRWFRFSGKAGDLVELYPFDAARSTTSELEVDVELYAAGELATPVALESMGAAEVYRTILVKDGEYLVSLHGGEVGSLTFLLQRFGGAAFETEGAAQPSPFDAQGWAAGLVEDAADVDSFALSADAGQLVSVSLYAGWGTWGDDYASWGSTLSPVLQVRDAQGAVLATATADTVLEDGSSVGYAQSLNRSGSSLELSFRAPARGSYTVSVADDGSGSQGFYALQLWKNQ